MENIIIGIGLVGGICTTISFLPQVIKAIRTKHTKDLSLPMIILQMFGIISWGIYGLFKSDIPIISANSVSLAIMTSVLFLKLKYS